MSEAFKGSIAQVNVQFPIETVLEPLAGENYTRVLIYIPESLAETYLPGVTSAATKKVYEVTSSSYGAMTGGLLKTWLAPFFASASAAKVGVAIWDDGEDADDTLAVVYAATKMYAYFKMLCCGSTDYNTNQVALSTLCLDDPLYSDCHIGTTDTNVKSGTSTLVSALLAANSNARVVFNPSATKNPALCQLGKTLGSLNGTGTPIGNSLDMVGFNTIEASGATDADGVIQNLEETEKAACDEKHVGYNTWVGDGTEDVVTEGSLTLQGESVGANWVKHYIEYMCKVKTATYITRMNRFRNNQTYQGVLLILCDIVKKFIDIGRLDKFNLTAPVFGDLPKSGDQITVPNAWSATYIDNTREVTVYGTLYITKATR